VINARSETAAEKRMFRDAFNRARCVLPASGFFEWRDRDAGSQPFHFFARDFEGVLLGAIVVEHGEEKRVLVLTGQADPWMREIHHRAPLLVRPDRLEEWLRRDCGGEEASRRCCFRGQEKVLERHPVSSRVNRVAENDRWLLEAVPEETTPRQSGLFGA